MMTRMRALSRAALTFLFLLSASALASPPPPPEPAVHELAQKLLAPLTKDTFDGFADLLSNKLSVTIDGSTVARSKDEWLSIERRRLGKTHQYLIALAEGGGETCEGVFYKTVMVIDKFEDRSDIDPSDLTVYDPRPITRAIKYRIGDDDLIHAIDMLQGGPYLSTAP